jgi:hypothetical protein
MKIAHEAPLSIFDQVQELTDYDYALVHLFEENEEYYNKFIEARDKGREIILDNSIFELGTAWDSDRFAYWVEKLKPDWYIVPDVLDNKDATIDSFDAFVEKYPDLPGKRIAVAQGSTYEELVECYEYLAYHHKVDKVALSFNHPFFQDLDLNNKYFNMMWGRQMTLAAMVENNIINKDKPHHLLGCGLPQEFKDYVNYEWVDSIDTSNPVMHGIKGVRYLDHGLEDKESLKMFTIMDDNVLASWDDIAYNIDRFREFCRA